MKIENFQKAKGLCQEYERLKRENDYLRDKFTISIFMGKDKICVSDEFLKQLRKDLIEENRKEREKLRKQIEEL